MGCAPANCTRPALSLKQKNKKTGYERPESFEYYRHYPAARRP